MAETMSAKEYREAFSRQQSGPSRNKYGAKRTEVDGVMFDSAAEAKRWCDLQLLSRAGAIKGLRRQVHYPLIVNGLKVGTYVADFVYVVSAGEVVEDVKSKPTRTATYKLKRQLMRALYNIDIQEVE